MIKLVKIQILLVFVLLRLAVQAQFLSNPSFEGEGQDNQPPLDWTECSGSPDNPPLPEEILVELPASHGDRYLSMRARGDIPNETFTNYRGVRDKVSTRLLKPLEKGRGYKLSIDLATDYEVVLFMVTTPMDSAQIRIWAGNGLCDQAELLASSGPVTNTNWEPFELCFTPQNDTYNYFFLEADYIDGDTLNGIILADNLRIVELNPGDTLDASFIETIADTTIILEAKGVGSYNWLPEPGLSCYDCKNPTYTVTGDVDLYIEIDGQMGCRTVERHRIRLLGCEYYESIYSGLKLDTLIEYGDEVRLNAPYGQSFEWSPGSFLSCSDCASPIASPELPTTYICKAVDRNNCVLNFEYRFDIQFKVPNVITPNSDGFNDNFFIEGLPGNTKLRIIDRLGNLVYQTNNYENNWPLGTGRGIEKQTDTYWYLLEREGIKPMQGFVLVKF